MTPAKDRAKLNIYYGYCFEYHSIIFVVESKSFPHFLFYMLRLLINLDRSPDRYESMIKKLACLGLDAERISAVEGKKLSYQERQKILITKGLKRRILCPRDLSLGEIGCFLSHRLCWERLCDSNHNFALVLEDDIQFSERARYYLSSEDWIPKEINLIQLCSTRPSQRKKARVGKTYILHNGDKLLHPYFPVFWGTLGYIISKKAAAQALEMSQRIYAPVDEFLFNPLSDFSKKIDSYRINPSVITTDEENLFKTTIADATQYRKKMPLRLRALGSICKKFHYLKIYSKSTEETMYFS